MGNENPIQGGIILHFLYFLVALAAARDKEGFS
jgi:hypothetical protein